MNGGLRAQATATPGQETGLSKSAASIGKITLEDGKQHPIYKYTLTLSGVNGDVEIIDTFDPDLRYFNIYEYLGDSAISGQYSALKIDTDKDEVFRSAQDNSGQKTLPSDYPYTVNDGRFKVGYNRTESEGSIKFNVALNKLPLNGDQPFNTYTFTYYLVADDLESLNERSQDVHGPISLRNSATWTDAENGTSTATVEYQYPVVDKTITGLGENAESGEIDTSTLSPSKAFAAFQIVVNEDRTDMPLDETTGKVKLTDTFDNLSVDYSTIKIYIEDVNGNRTDVTDSTDWNYTGYTGTFHLEDKTKYVITYKARIIGSGIVPFSNTARINGYSSTVEESASVEGSGGGEVENYWVRIYKYEGYTMNKPVPGAVYTLVDENGDPMVYPSTAKNGKVGQPITFTTDSNGYARVFLSEDQDGISIQKGIKYYLKETEAPAGYQVNPTIYNFTISDHPNYNNTTNYEYYVDDILKIWDNPKEGVLEIDKGVTIDGNINAGKTLSDEQKKNIVFTISGTRDDGENFETITVTYDQFTNDKYLMEDLKPGTYIVTETNYNLEGFTHDSTTAISVNENTEEIVNDYTFTFVIPENESASTEHVVSYTNAYGSVPYNLTIKKVGPTGQALYGAEFMLEKYVDGTYVPAENGSLDAEGKFLLPYESKDTGITIYNLTDGEYRLSETKAPSGYRATAGTFTFTISGGKLINSSGGSQISYSAGTDNESGTVTVTNTTEYGYTFTKAEAGATTTRLPGAKFNVYQFDRTATGGQGTLIESLTTDENGQFEILKSNNEAYQDSVLYYVVESEAPEGYEKNETKYYFYWGNYDLGNAEGYATNANTVNLGSAQIYSLVEDEPKSLNLKVKKVWSGIDTIPTDSIQFKVFRTETTPGSDPVKKQYPDNDTVFTLTQGTSDSETNWTVVDKADLLKNLPVGKSEDGVHTAYSYSIEEVSRFEGLESKITISKNTYDQDDTYDIYTITNRPETVEITVNKVWVDDVDHSNNKTTQKIMLYRRNNAGKDDSFNIPWSNSPYTLTGGNHTNNTNGGAEIELSYNNGWTATISGLEKGDPSDPWIYYVEESNVPDGYTATVSDPVSEGTITVTNTKKTTGIAVHKVWDLADGEEVPDSVTVQLMKAGEKTDPDALHVKYYLYNNWNTGTEHTLVIKNGTSFEISQGGLTGDYLIGSGSGTVTYNQGKVTVSNASDGLIIGIKTGWGFDGESVNSTSAVSPDINTGSPVEGKTVTLTAPNWYGEWKGLEDGYYYITETKVGDTELSSSGYEVTYTNNDGIKTGTITATNTKTEPQTGKIIVKKTFKGVTGDDLTALQNGLTVTITGKDVGGTGNNTLELRWSDVQGEGKTIDNLPLSEKYQITESITGDDATTVLAKYEQVTTGTDASVTSFTNVEPTVDGVTNELVNSYEPKTTDFEFSKIWNDIGSQPTTWPKGATITVKLNAYTDSATQTAVLQDQTLTFSLTDRPEGWSVETSSDGKKTTFKVEGLAKYSSDGKELHYYVTETQVDGYKAPAYATSEGSGLVFTGSDDVPKATNGQQIINTPEGGYELPSTGGPGTWLFTILGSILILGAGVLLLKRRKLI